VCGRFTLELTDLHELPEWLGIERDLIAEWRPRYNIAPSQDAPILVGGLARTLLSARWGLLPVFAKTPADGNRMINARVETVARLPAFREAFRSKRCVVPATGFYEWRGTHRAPRQPFWIHPPQGGVLALAGLWSTWVSKDGEVIESFSIVTTEARGAVRELHDRMPLFLPPVSLERWLAPGAINPGELTQLIEAGSHTELATREVDPRVNSSIPDDPACIAPRATSAARSPQLSLFELAGAADAGLYDPDKK
jgi:putative SOS response-associated peptidase YedK